MPGASLDPQPAAVDLLRRGDLVGGRGGDQPVQWDPGTVHRPRRPHAQWRASAVTLRPEPRRGHPGRPPTTFRLGQRQGDPPGDLDRCAQRAGDRPARRKSWAMCPDHPGGPDLLQIAWAMTIAAWSNLLIAAGGGAGIPLALRARLRPGAGVEPLPDDHHRPARVRRVPRRGIGAAHLSGPGSVLSVDGCAPAPGHQEPMMKEPRSEYGPRNTTWLPSSAGGRWLPPQVRLPGLRMTAGRAPRVDDVELGDRLTCFDYVKNQVREVDLGVVAGARSGPRACLHRRRAPGDGCHRRSRWVPECW